MSSLKLNIGQKFMMNFFSLGLRLTRPLSYALGTYNHQEHAKDKSTVTALCSADVGVVPSPLTPHIEGGYRIVLEIKIYPLFKEICSISPPFLHKNKEIFYVTKYPFFRTLRID